eukprot:1568626-Amphidinium_carterae.1
MSVPSRSGSLSPCPCLHAGHMIPTLSCPFQHDRSLAVAVPPADTAGAQETEEKRLSNCRITRGCTE